ncbi:hypothetical protein F2Q69_00009386 [Brassica cretica]|uniref:Uncharacterized protein n=1 Tax=Brassica cretica TaxID=69181 RepID=A0A8S9PB60_BRACR|nr:hypothetical protein F2Q69_00009386 [Brassica cretica]
MKRRLAWKNLKRRNSAEIEPSGRSEIDQPQSPSPKSRSDISPSLTTEGHHRVPDVEKSLKVEAQPTRLSDAPSRTARSPARESHAPPPSTGVYVCAAHAPPSPTTVFRCHHIRPPSVCRQETATVSPPRLHCRRHRVCVHVELNSHSGSSITQVSGETDEQERLLPGGLLKGEVLGLTNARRTNNLPEGSLGITGEGLVLQNTDPNPSPGFPAIVSVVFLVNAGPCLFLLRFRCPLCLFTLFSLRLAKLDLGVFSGSDPATSRLLVQIQEVSALEDGASSSTALHFRCRSCSVCTVWWRCGCALELSIECGEVPRISPMSLFLLPMVSGGHVRFSGVRSLSPASSNGNVRWSWRRVVWQLMRFRCVPSSSCPSSGQFPGGSGVVFAVS